ncbi:MAG: UDP-N-acetylmuramate--L-alanine ligase [candidate division WOR-3 bacterium]|jgi:UDP-N-acetylmuramate--alanine ligase
MFGRLKRVHFVGIGGAGMSGIALVLKNLGFEVTGSDIQASDVTERLHREGIKVYIGHRTENCADAEVVVFSTAVTEDNPELVCARSRGVPVIRRAEMLAELMRLKFSIAISGSHGKTTTTSLVTHILTRAGLDPTAVIGGRIVGAETGARLGRSEYLVVEADESDRSFVLLYPAIAVVTNIEPEHLDYYKNLQDLKKEFIRFVNRVPFYGSVILCLDSPAVRSIRNRIDRRVVTYGVDSEADFKVEEVQLYRFSSAFTVVYQGKPVGRFSLAMAGRHNVQNALAGIAVGTELGIDFATIEQALATFTGVHRRLERKGEEKGIVVFDDYGHHPTEIRVTIEALRHAYPDNRIFVIFQPHRYTRTMLLAEEFGSAFDRADEVVITGIYAAAEPPIPGVDEQMIVAAVRSRGRPGLTVHHQPELSAAAEFVVPRLKRGDVVLTLGAGSITRLADELLKLIREQL